MSAPVPRAYIYKYADPFTGEPVWRGDCYPWNGQRPSETIPLYDASALAEAVAREREACAKLAETHFVDAGVYAKREHGAGMGIAAAIRARE